MVPAAVLLVTTAAAFHACWNLLAKRSGDKVAFFCLVGVAGTVLLLPVALLSAPAPTWPAAVWGRVGLAAGLRAAYFLALGAAYARGDFSLVYPFARGTAPVLVPVMAVLLLGERLTLGGGFGVTAVALGVYAIHLPGLAPRQWLSPVRALASPHAGYAILTGVLTATYSVVDKWNIGSGISPVWYAYLTIPVAALLLAPMVLPRRPAVGREWRAHRGAIAVVAILMTGGYLLVLHALRLAPVSYVAPARELSIVFGALLGATVLGERHLPQRVLGAALIVAGVITLAAAPASR